MLLSTLRKLVFDPRVVPARRNRRAPPCKRPPTRKPCAELLEERLPPGELLLGGLLGSALCGPSLSATDSELWTPEGVSPAPLSASLPAAGQSEWTATMSGRLAAESVLTSADDRAERPRREGGEAGSAVAPLLAGANGDGPQRSAPALFDTDSLFASALRDPLQGSGAPSRDGAATSSEPVVGLAQGGGVAAGGGGAAASLNVAVGTSAGGPGVAQFAAPAGASSNLAPLNHDAGPAGASSAAAAAAELGPTVHATFDLSESAGAVFPSDRFTIDDANNLTGLRVNLPLPYSNPSNPAQIQANQDTQVLKTLDGFNLQPRLSIPFDGAIDPTSVKSSDVFLINLGDTVDHQEHGDQIVGINQIVWDPATNTLHAESDQLLDQHTRYALIVTNGVLDTNGQPVQASEDFTRFLHDLNFGQTQDSHLKEYRKELLDATAAAAQIGVPEPAIVTASVFTTESATAVLEKIRDQIDTAPPPAAANFHLPMSPGGPLTTNAAVFSFNQVSGITLTQQTGWTQDPVTGQPVPVYSSTPTSGTQKLSLLQKYYPGAVGEIAFGSYQSPDYEAHPGEYIPRVDTLTGTPDVQGTNTIYFDLVLPSGQPSDYGLDAWPVAIYGHGGGSNKDTSMFLVAASMAKQHIATIIINNVGNGYGPDSYLTVNPGSTSSVTFLAGGRGIDQNGDGNIGGQEGFQATLDPNTGQDWSLITGRDGVQQTVADLMQLVRVIQGPDGHGMSVPAPVGSPPNTPLSQLDPNSIYYFGWSDGANIGAPFLAVEPDVLTGTLTNPGYGYIDEAGRIAPGNRPSITNGLIARGLINSTGITSIDGVSVTGPYFDENMPLRDGISLNVGLVLPDGTKTTSTIQSPVTNTVDGAMAIQEFFDSNEWAAQAGNPVAYAPHLHEDPLAGVLPKSVIVQFADGDQIAANPNVWALIRAGGLADRATFFLYDLGSHYTTLPNNTNYPHRFLVATDTVPSIAFPAQGQIADFFASKGTNFINPSAVPEPPSGGVSPPSHFADYFFGDGTVPFNSPLLVRAPDGTTYDTSNLPQITVVAQDGTKFDINLEGLNFVT